MGILLRNIARFCKIFTQLFQGTWYEPKEYEVKYSMSLVVEHQFWVLQNYDDFFLKDTGLKEFFF